MKKKIISLAAVAIVAVAAAVGVSKNANKVELSELALANVEALAGNENSDIMCTEWTDSYCDFVVTTPSGSWVESHPDMIERP